ncbi:MAG: FAD-dependent oxidoreductase [Rhodopila sp.]
MQNDGPIKVAIIGGGCASITTAFELTRPHHRGKYQVTVYQLGWRLGGKGASGRGPSGRIEEHGLHIWLGFYENAFRLLREAYAELDRDPAACPLATWRDAFFPEPHVGVTERDRSGAWTEWLTHFPPAEGLPGDPIEDVNPFTFRSYVARTLTLLRTVLFSTHTGQKPAAALPDLQPATIASVVAKMTHLLRIGALSSIAAVSEALGLLAAVIRALPLFPEKLVGRLLEAVVDAIRARLEDLVATQDGLIYKWEVIDLVLAFLAGCVRFRLMTDRRGMSAIDQYECRDWLRLNGASERSLNSAFVRGLYDLALAYESGDPAKPGLAAGQALRGSLRMFFTYRGALFWKMRSGMGDCVFSPFYEVLKRRGVRFEFFHRLENVCLTPAERLLPGEKPFVEALEFDVQAEIEGGGEYQPLLDIKGVPCWPSAPDFSQLVDGERMRQEGRRFESFWDRRRTGARTLRVSEDFDFVVLGVSVGAIPHVCRDILTRDQRWRDMVANVKTVATQAFQVWLNQDMASLGWAQPPVTLSAFTKPFDTWADMAHVIPEEDWRTPPKAVAYFCNILADPPQLPGRDDAAYEQAARAEVRRNAIGFLNNQIHHLWPHATAHPGWFRWELLVDESAVSPGPQGEARFDTQYWTANINPSDRYVLMLPGTLRYRISPLDNSYDNLTIAGDWTDCGYNAGCVEAAVMSGRLAAHAISLWPLLEDITGYDHP